MIRLQTGAFDTSPTLLIWTLLTNFALKENNDLNNNSNSTYNYCQIVNYNIVDEHLFNLPSIFNAEVTTGYLVNFFSFG